MKNNRIILIFLLTFSFSLTLLGNESVIDYFPVTLDSNWIYVNEDGNEMTRTVVEGEEIAGENYYAFSYEPAIKNSVDFEHYLHSSLFKIDEKGIKFLIDDNLSEAYSERLRRDWKTFLETNINTMPQDPGIETKFEFDVNIETKEQFLMLPFPIQFNKEWESIRIKPTFKIIVSYKQTNPEFDPELVGRTQTTEVYYTIIETGEILGTETVDIPAGNFEDCLKVEFRTKTVTPFFHMDGDPTAGESVSTLWFAPNVGIVKYRKEVVLPLLRFDPNVKTTTQVKTLELKKYEIKTKKAVAE